MSATDYRVEPYTPEAEQEWDRFVMQESANGTFLQTRRFLNYHPEGRFQDASLVVRNQKGAMVAVVPAAVVQREGKRVFVSHPGSTYGGPVIRETYTSTAYAIDILQGIEAYLKAQVDRVEFKLTPELFQKSECLSLDYACYYLDYEQISELSTYVSLKEQTEESLLEAFRQNKKQDVRKAQRLGLTFRQLETLEEIQMFYQLLEKNLQKFDTTPVHTLEELMEFKEARLKDEVAFFGVFAEDSMVAGSMLFLFPNLRLAHTQYLAAEYDSLPVSPAAFQYYQILVAALLRGYETVSWGISTENRGKVINLGLIGNKEGYGSKHNMLRTYCKSFTGE